jgi:hypothetical protein
VQKCVKVDLEAGRMDSMFGEVLGFFIISKMFPASGQEPEGSSQDLAWHGGRRSGEKERHLRNAWGEKRVGLGAL